MKIAFVTPELNALVRRTSLAEVSESLPRTLRQEGGDVRVFLPFTADVNAAALQDLKQVGEVRVKDPGGDAEAVRSLFDRFLEARKAAGESGAVKFESFQKVISQQAARILSEKGAQAVDFRLETKDGKVSLKAKPER